MSNRVAFQPTKFVDFDPTTGADVEVSWGYRIFDDYGKTYNNLMTREEVMDLTPLGAWDLITSVSELHEFVESIDRKGGFLFCDEWIDLESLT